MYKSYPCISCTPTFVLNSGGIVYPLYKSHINIDNEKRRNVELFFVNIDIIIYIYIYIYICNTEVIVHHLNKSFKVLFITLTKQILPFLLCHTLICVPCFFWLLSKYSLYSYLNVRYVIMYSIKLRSRRVWVRAPLLYSTRHDQGI